MAGITGRRSNQGSERRVKSGVRREKLASQPGGDASPAAALAGEEPSVRSAALARARVLLADPNYPQDAVLRKLARRFAREWFG